MHAARRAFGGWSTTTPGERALAMIKLADTIEEHADEISELESANAGKPINAFRDDEIPFMVDNLRFFAGAARCLEGRAAGEYMSALHVEPEARGGGSDRSDHPVELSPDDGGVEDRPGARGR